MLDCDRALFLGLQAACTNYGGLCECLSNWYRFVESNCFSVALRVLLGAAEGCMSTGLMIIIGMFYTRREIGERIGWCAVSRSSFPDVR